MFQGISLVVLCVLVEAVIFQGNSLVVFCVLEEAVTGQ